MLVDIHTHRWEQPEGTLGVVSCGVDDDWRRAAYCSVGIHPWDVDEAWEQRLDRLRGRLERGDGAWRVVAVGECGLDRSRGGDWELQKACFGAQVSLAEELGLPLIVHCVGGWDSLMRMVRRCSVPVIVHGYRRNPALAQRLMALGVELSFGPRFNSESVRQAYARRRLWLETDDSGVGIAEVYEAVSRVLNISPTDIELPGTLRLGAI